MFYVAIVEDNPDDAKLLRACLARYEKETGEEVKVALFDTAEKFIGGYKTIYDLVLMDIVLPFASGMEAAKQLRSLDMDVALIFTTDMAQYALRGYEVDAMDYFLKPVKYFALKLRLDKIRIERANRITPVSIHLPHLGDKYVPSEQVYYIEILGKRLTYHTALGTFEGRDVGLRQLAERLSGAGFVRCNASYLVNLKWCTDVRAGEVTVAGDVLPISRGMKNGFMERLSQFYANNNLRRKQGST